MCQTRSPAACGARAGLGNSSCVAADNPEITQLSTETQLSPTDAVKAALIRDLLSECLSIAIPAACKAIQLTLSGDDSATLIVVRDFHAASRVAFQAARELRDVVEGDSA